MQICEFLHVPVLDGSKDARGYKLVECGFTAVHFTVIEAAKGLVSHSFVFCARRDLVLMELWYSNVLRFRSCVLF